MIQVVASSDVHYDQPGADGNCVFLDQIPEADETWTTTKYKAVNFTTTTNQIIMS